MAYTNTCSHRAPTDTVRPLLRRPLTAVAIIAAIATVLVVWFWVLEPPPDRDGCNTSMPEGYGIPLAAAHAAAAVALGGLLVWLGLSRGERIVLGGVAVLGTAA